MSKNDDNERYFAISNPTQTDEGIITDSGLPRAVQDLHRVSVGCIKIDEGINGCESVTFLRSMREDLGRKMSQTIDQKRLRASITGLRGVASSAICENYTKHALMKKVHSLHIDKYRTETTEEKTGRPFPSIAGGIRSAHIPFPQFPSFGFSLYEPENP